MDDLVLAEVEDVQVVFAFESKNDSHACQESHRFDDLILVTLSLNHNVIVLFMNFDHGETLVGGHDVELLVVGLRDSIDVTLVLLVLDLPLGDDCVLFVVDDRQVAALLPTEHKVAVHHLQAGHVVLLKGHCLCESRLLWVREGVEQEFSVQSSQG